MGGEDAPYHCENPRQTVTNPEPDVALHPGSEGKCRILGGEPNEEKVQRGLPADVKREMSKHCVFTRSM